MCASEGIIGPISDLIHISTEEEDQVEFVEIDEEGNDLRNLEDDSGSTSFRGLELK